MRKFIDWWGARPVATLTVTLVCAAVVPVLLGVPLTKVTQLLIFALYAAGVNVLIGYLGLVPFGASFFFGIAGYGLAYMILTRGENEIVAILMSVVMTVALAIVVGAVILRRKGLYFALLTLACSQIAFEIAIKWTSVTGGENGLQNIPRAFFDTDEAFHAFTLVVVLGCLMLMARLAHSPTGRALQAVRDNELRASMLGYNVFQIKLVGFCFAAALIGVAGSLIGLLLRGVYANYLSWQHAGDPVLMATLGGVQHFLGPLWGAAAFVLLEDQLSGLTENWWLMFAPIIILFAMLSPGGLHGAFQKLFGFSRRTLTNDRIPPRPANVEAYTSGSVGMTGTQPVLSIKGLSKSFGPVVTSRDISLDVYPKQLHSIIGPNGAGKSTFFNILSGIVLPDAGRIVFDGTDITRLPTYRRSRLGIGRSFQILSVFQNLTAFENVRIAVQASRRQWWRFWRNAYSDAASNQRVWAILEAVGLSERAGAPCSELSHGQKRLLEIAVTLATDAKLLLLDEPLAGLTQSDREIVGRLIKKLAETHAVLLVEHDIDRVLDLSDRISVLHQGRMIADGPPAEVVKSPEVVSAYLGQAHGKVEVVAPPPDGLAAPSLLSVKGLVGGYAGGGSVLQGIDLEVRQNEVVALLGRNGVGKTTLLRAIMGTLPIESGSISLGGKDLTRQRPSRINREGISIVPEGRRVFEDLTVATNLQLASRKGGASVEEIYSLFPKLQSLAQNKAGTLSGGERQMLAIARALMSPSKVILLDEPFEGLAPSVVADIKDAVAKLRTRASLVIVEHDAHSVLAMADRAYVLVNGAVAFAGTTYELSKDEPLQHRLLGVGARTAAV